MVTILKFRSIFFAVRATNPPTLSPCTALRYCHFESEWDGNALEKNSKSSQTRLRSSVGIFWDLDNKPPKSLPPYEAANKLKAAASHFGVVRHMVAYANRHTFSHVPQDVREQRKERRLLNQLENKGVIKPDEPYLCRVCGRKFYTNEKLVNHFKQIHEREHMKRLNQIESAKGSRRVKLVAKYSMKMQKYKNAVRGVLTPKVGYGLADELKRAGFWVRTVLDKPQAADLALNGHMVDMMDKRQVECVVLVSDDSDFANVLKEAKLRCLKTVVVGDTNDGALKRTADAAFSWEEILMGKAKKEAVSVVEKWKDRNILNRLEWTYKPEVEKKKFTTEEEEEEEDSEYMFDEVDGVGAGAYKNKGGSNTWWELDTDDHDFINQQSGK
ncbi:Zinc finger family protein [Senna tora]|uniref:Zinc finger family protein n=1 Tax=Senna tora TaxID=362788 RepID=A0A834X2L2_9FABA|nr:Zinc finger family protein [Senna tora]